MNEGCLELISKEFCGDFEDSLYEYKTGPQLVQFFNDYFGYSDVYRSGFLTRWIYVRNKIEELYNQKRISDFFIIIMSVEFIMIENSYTEIEATIFLEKLKDHWNRKLRPYHYQIVRNKDKYYFINYDEDLEFIAEGGFANVYLQRSSGKVIKKLKRELLIDEGSRHRFKREYELTSSLSYLEGVIEVYDFNEVDYFYVMEKCDYTLYDFLETNQLDIGSKEAIIENILSIITEIHGENIIHRDLTANNIFIRGSQILVADFGLGKNFDFLFSHKTTHTAQLGQIQYCPPEQLMNLGNTGKYSDVYSLGRLINFIMTNNPNEKDHKYKVLVEKATSVTPEDRYIDAKLLLENFRKVKSYANDKEIKEEILATINRRLLNDKVKYYISSLDSKSLCENIIKISGFIEVLKQYLTENPESINDIVNAIQSDIKEVAVRFEHNDYFADISYFILERNLSTFEVREKAAFILLYVAQSVNRWSAQRLIDRLIDNGIEPMIEEILEPGKSK